MNVVRGKCQSTERQYRDSEMLRVETNNDRPKLGWQFQWLKLQVNNKNRNILDTLPEGEPFLEGVRGFRCTRGSKGKKKHRVRRARKNVGERNGREFGLTRGSKRRVKSVGESRRRWVEEVMIDTLLPWGRGVKRSGQVRRRVTLRVDRLKVHGYSGCWGVDASQKGGTNSRI